jgi:excinuclease ABC subunit A
LNRAIKIQGAREHNLKNISVEIPKDRFVVITGPSGSGKSSLAFDTLYAEGQRRYVESLSSYARQFLGIQNKPDVDDISGLSPAISIEQKGTSHNPRSTVGTVTEIYDYIRLLFGRIGIPYCPECGKPVRSHSLDEIIEVIYENFKNKKIHVLAPQVRSKKGEFKNLFAKNKKEGFMRVRVDGTQYWLEEDIPLDRNRKHSIEVVIDRLKVIEDRRGRISEAIETSLGISGGSVLILTEEGNEKLLTENSSCPDCDITLPMVEPRLFSFNNPSGACPHCSGLGSHQYFSEELAVDPKRNVPDGALLPWGRKHYMITKLQHFAGHNDWNLDVPYSSLSKEVSDFILYGSNQRIPLVFKNKGKNRKYMGRYEGLIPWLERRWKDTDSDIVTEELARYRYEDICEHCHGLRLRPEALMVKVSGYSISDFVRTPVNEVVKILDSLELSEKDIQIAGQILRELRKRVTFLVDVGVGYLNLERRADTLSGGESQRIRLATQIGSKLSGVMYVLDEPTIGLHPRDTGRLLKTLSSIRDLGNTVIVVEHDRDTMLAADHIIEMGPAAGESGGEIVQSGEAKDLVAKNSLTSPYLLGKASGVVKRAEPGVRRPSSWLTIKGAEHNNLKKVDVSFPKGLFTCITGVSGSGKSSLVHEVLYKGIRRLSDRNYRVRPGKYSSMKGWEDLRNTVLIDQSPIGRTPRSNPATYTGVFTLIRELFSRLPESEIKGYTPGRFSFNVKGGRCEACGGAGSVRVSMLFLPDVYVTCEVCNGKRYNRETLDVEYKGKNISDVLEMTVDEAARFFADIPAIAAKLVVLQQAGLGYIKLGQSALTLSGGEAQRVKLAKELSKRFAGHTLYLLDEPTSGLFYTDIKKLLKILHKFVEKGNSVVLIEHNLDVIASCDHIIDLGPEGGSGGGFLVDQGTPEEIMQRKKGYTGKYLSEYVSEMMDKGGM